ncbi:MAG: hypothetical protein DMG38_23240 [Acidobacteria bacterium]|nr:MAG: hypothetical protein DMG38_23240 [Acidobacteriota bacterium]
MICNIGFLKRDCTRVSLRVTALLGLLFTMAPLIQSQTTTCPMSVPHGCKPSDVFFGDPSSLQIAEDKIALTSIGQEVGKNYLSPHSIVAKDVVLRGWLAKDPGPVSPVVSVGFSPIGAGISDVHYELVLDYDFINSTYGADVGVLTGAVLHGHGPNTWDAQATPIPMKNSVAKTASGIDINSFWLATNQIGNVPLTIHTELNAWHPDSSHRGCKWVFGNPVSCSTHNFEGREAAPAGWIEKDYGPVEVNSSHNWWPFDPDNPDGLNTPLSEGDYVEMRGTLWQDIKHLTPGDLGTLCWGQSYPNQDGWLEIHPVDSLRRIPAPGRHSPLSDPLGSATAGVKRVVGVPLCSNGHEVTPTGSYLVICPEANYAANDPNLAGRTPKPLVPNILELIDGRFTDIAPGPASNPRRMAHGISAEADCVRIYDYWLPGTTAHYKATYVVSWTPAANPIGIPTTTTKPHLGGPALAAQPLLAVSACPTVDGKTCLASRPSGATNSLVAIVTVRGGTSNGAAVAGSHSQCVRPE